MNINQIRQDILNYNDKLFLNSASSSLPAKSVVQKITEYLVEEQQIGGYKSQELHTEAINRFYTEAAQLLNCHPKNIAFANNATDAFAKAMASIDFKKGDIIITSDDDYVANQFQFIALQKRFGIIIKRIATFDNGDLDISHFESLITKERPKIVALAHVPTGSGLVQNVKAVGNICYKNDILFLLDACQSVGQMHVDVQEIKCDFLSVTGRKFLRGPRGTGILYVSDKILNSDFYPLTIDSNGADWIDNNNFKLFDSAKRFEFWESSRALVVGFGEALRYLNAIGIQNIEQRNTELITHLRNNLSAIEEITLHDKGSKTCNILTFRKQGKSLDKMISYLDKNNVFYSISSKPSSFIDFNKKGVDWVIRLSPHYFNTFEELDSVSNLIELV